MHNASVLDALFPSVRSSVFTAVMLQPERWWFMTELARHLRKTPSSLQRELESLAAAGLLLRRQDGRRVYFKANADSPVFGDLRGLMEKTAGLVPALSAALKPFRERVEIAILYGSIARGEEHAGSDVDLMLVGSLKLIDLLPALRKLERQFGRQVNVTLFSRPEFRSKLASGDHFLRTVLKGKTTLLKGSLDELEKAGPREEGSSAHHQPA